MKVFVTVGTTSFDELVSEICKDDIQNILRELGYQELVIQFGRGEFTPHNYSKQGFVLWSYRYKDSIQPDIKNADLVISHAGAGSCLEVLGQGKKLIVVINESLMNNHQFELAEQLHKDGHLLHCTPRTLPETLRQINEKVLLPFEKGDPMKFRKFLDNYFGITT